MKRKKIIIDCDPGADDVIALLFALGCPELEVIAVTIIAGNRRAEICAQNAMKILEHCNRTDIPVYIGADGPLERVLPKDDIYSGRDGMAEMFLPYCGTTPQNENAVDMLCQLAKQYRNELSIVSIAPMTNLALAIRQDATFGENIAEVITINGSYGLVRNPLKCDSRMEWNVLVDPEAAKIVMESGIRISALGIDVTGTLTNRLHENLLRSGKPGTVPYNMLVDAEKFLKTRGLHAAGLYVDAMAIAYAVDDTIAKFACGKVEVETKGETTTGFTRFDNVGNITNCSNIGAAYDFDMERFEKLLHERAFG